MIYLFHGESKKVFEKSNKLIDDLLAKKTDAEVFRVNSDNWENFNIDELIGGQSLFTKKYIVQMTRIFENEILAENIFDKILQIKKSENIFVFSQPDLSDKILKKIEKSCDKIQDLRPADIATKKSKKGFGSPKSFSNFVLADAFGERDAKKAWLLYLQIIKKSAPEEIHGMLWWQLKNIIIVANTKSASESGLAPFVYSKAKRFSKNFTLDELESLSDNLVWIYHEAHRGGADLKIRLEKFLLNL
ncbi:MAG TPA: hypothetical protein PKA60_00805 [Candidatus Paceibacterota bacterium]|nr:hypothetical protein [Candidatus Paceibacterota bacterium]